MNSHEAINQTYKAEFEKRDNGQRVGNPAADWQTVTREVSTLDNRNAGRGYAAYSQRRIFEGESHEQAMEWVSKIVQWQ